MPKQKMFTPEAEFILALSRTTMAQQGSERLRLLEQPSLDWEKIISLSLSHGTAALVYRQINSCDFLAQRVPAEALTKLKNYYYANLARTLKLWQEFCCIDANFKKHNLGLIPLKGIILGNLVYRNPALRPIFADIDLLVRKNDLSRASALLAEMGFAPSLAPHIDYQKMFKKGTLLVDLHWGIVVPWLSRVNPETLWQRSRIQTLEHRQIRALSLEDMLLTLPLQMRYDFPFIKLLRFCDINEILSWEKSSLDWDYLIKGSRQYCLRGILLFSLFICQALFGSCLPRHLLQELCAGSPKRKTLLMFLKKMLAAVMDPDLQFRKGRSLNYLLKSFLIDHPADYFKIIWHKF